MLINICIKFREYSLSGFQVIEWTRFVTDRRTPGEKQYVSRPLRTHVLKALPGKLDIKRHSPSILYLFIGAQDLLLGQSLCLFPY